MTTRDTLPDPHPGLSPRLNAQVAQSLIEGGAKLSKLPVGGALRVRTQNTTYRIERIAEGETGHPFLLSGHPRICPQPRRATITGSTFGRGGMLRIGFVGHTMNMEFHVEGETRAYTTTTIDEVEEAAADPDATSAGR